LKREGKLIVLNGKDAEDLLDIVDRMWEAQEDKSKFCCGFFNPVHEFRALFKEVLLEEVKR
jgi:hypothetical protein